METPTLDNVDLGAPRLGGGSPVCSYQRSTRFRRCLHYHGLVARSCREIRRRPAVGAMMATLRDAFPAASSLGRRSIFFVQAVYGDGHGSVSGSALAAIFARVGADVTAHGSKGIPVAVGRIASSKRCSRRGIQPRNVDAAGHPHAGCRHKAVQTPAGHFLPTMCAIIRPVLRVQASGLAAVWPSRTANVLHGKDDAPGWRDLQMRLGDLITSATLSCLHGGHLPKTRSG